MPIIFIFIIALIFCFSHIRGQRAEEQKAEEEFLRNEEIRQKKAAEERQRLEAERRQLENERLRNEAIRRKIEKSREKMQNHPLLTSVESHLIAKIDIHLQSAEEKIITRTISDKIFLKITDKAVQIKSNAVEIIYDEFLFSSFGYDCFESVYDLQAFGENLYHSLKTHYANNSGLSWEHYEPEETYRYKFLGDVSCYYITIDFSACHPKLKSI